MGEEAPNGAAQEKQERDREAPWVSKIDIGRTSGIGCNARGRVQICREQSCKSIATTVLQHQQTCCKLLVFSQQLEFIIFDMILY